MTNQNELVNISFVVSEKFKNEEECNEEMWEAYNMCEQNEFQPHWIQETECHCLEPKKTDVFVMETFSGDVFEKLSQSKCLIVGPRCLLNCFLSGEPIPEGNSPVLTTAMRGTIICTTGLTPEIKKKIQQRVEYMGGIYMKQLRASVTHLISDSVMSLKYEKAIERGIPVLTDGWVDAIWQANMKEFVKYDDSRFDGYKCPVFMNLIVTATNLSKNQKETAKKLINENGGTFMGALDGSKVKVVLAPLNCSLTDKLRYARDNNIACLNVEWVTKSISAGYALPFTEYLVLSTKGCSTPDKSQIPALNCSSISMIKESVNTNHIVEETMTATMNSMTSANNVSLYASNDCQSLAPYISKLDRLDVREAKLAGPFLDGCNIYLTGFPTNHRDKINRILNAGGATRLNDISDSITHVIVGDPSKASNELKLIHGKGLNPHVLSLDWLQESLRLQRPAPEERFIDEKGSSPHAETAEPPSPLSKKNLQMLQRPKRPRAPQLDTDHPRAMENTTEGEDDETSLLQQYLQKTDENSASEITVQYNSTLKPTSKTVSRVDSLNISKTNVSIDPEVTKDRSNDSAVPYSQSTTSEKMFEGKTFLITGFDSEEASIIMENVVELGGRLVFNSRTRVPDYGVVPLLGAVLKDKVNEIVTELFIEDCIDQDKVVEFEYYHRPISISEDAKPLADLVIATSTYSGVERNYLTKLAVILGAQHQDTFARKTNLDRTHLASTHLICPAPKGSKYAAAVKWKLPAVTAEWLRACAKELKHVDETYYLVGEAIAPENSSKAAESSGMGPPSAATPRKIITPRRHFPQAQGTPGCETPPTNKNLSLAMGNTPKTPCGGTATPDTPYGGIATPETPYGRIFRENPSPATRKEWYLWTQKFPNLKEKTPPPPKRRNPSTPLSELRNQFWELVQVPIPPKQARQDEDGQVFEPGPSIPGGEQSHANITTREEGVEQATPLAEEQLIKRKLSYSEDVSKKAIERQIEQLDQVLRGASNTPESRYSPSGNAKVYNEQPTERMNKCMVKDSQPDTVEWEDPGHQRQIPYVPISLVEEAKEDETPMEEERKKKFMLSGIKDRVNYEMVIKKLGGELSTETHFDPTATHLLCIRPSRNEKMLGSIAGGKWVLHCTYLRDCDEKGEFINEEKYEWGNPLSKNVIPEPTGDTEKSIAAAVHRWRLKLSREPGGAFQEMVALLLVNKEKYDQFARLISAGGGTVVQAKAPYDSSPGGRRITHCFIQLNKLDQPVDWAMLASKGILCFQPQYLSEYLTAENPINPRDSVIPEFKKYLSLLPR
ncbi:DNA topoisomerase 2-binding protein 1 [Venturia canescens]|uniref:DNA topoisomerase 2-binding protein 1 n=1 Tax=Venturia canescens TaxID=32260 RepID=UPI001C9CF820|nr:DNA topoisomerase 2-binding protein 1 [Venturia canescens]